MERSKDDQEAWTRPGLCQTPEWDVLLGEAQHASWRGEQQAQEEAVGLWWVGWREQRGGSHESWAQKVLKKFVKNAHCFILIWQVQKWAFRGQGQGPPWLVEDQETRVPHLDRLVKKFLCVPATSTQAERVFSWMGWLLNKRRLCLSGESVNSQTLLERTLDWLIFTLSTINWSISKMDLLKSEFTCFRLFNYYLSLFIFYFLFYGKLPFEYIERIND